MPASEPTAAARIRELFAQAHQEADRIIDQIPDPEQAFSTAVEVDSQLRTLHNEASTRRKAKQAMRVKDEHKLSLGKLAQRLNRSKSAAALYVNTAQQQEGEDVQRA
jgi:hypothetical protein